MRVIVSLQFLARVGKPAFSRVCCASRRTVTGCFQGSTAIVAASVGVIGLPFDGFDYRRHTRHFISAILSRLVSLGIRPLIKSSSRSANPAGQVSRPGDLNV